MKGLLCMILMLNIISTRVSLLFVYSGDDT